MRNEGMGLSNRLWIMLSTLTSSSQFPSQDSIPPAMCSLFFPKPDSQLRVLRIPFSSISDPKFIPALRMCSRLEVLCIFPPTTDTLVQDVVLDTVPLTYLPCLRSYEGPYTHLLNICRQPLKHVSLWGFYERPALCDPDALAETLNNFAQQKSIESLRSLTVLVVGITFDLLQSFCAFESLERLIVQSQEREFPTNETISPRFYISVSLVIPPQKKKKNHSWYLCPRIRLYTIW